MIHAADDREWRNCDVVDSEGHKVGVLEDPCYAGDVQDNDR